MDTTTIIHFISESAYLLIVFSIFLLFAIFIGRQALINQICGSYLSLLVTIEFPYYDLLFKELKHAPTIAIAKIIFFIILTVVFTLLFKRLMPDEYREGKFESFGKKIALALGATVLVMIFSFNILPVSEILSPGTPIQSLFNSQQYFFWWLIAPLIILAIN